MIIFLRKKRWYYDNNPVDGMGGVDYVQTSVNHPIYMVPTWDWWVYMGVMGFKKIYYIYIYTVHIYYR